MTPYELTGLGVVLFYYALKWLNKKEEELCEEIWEFERQLDDYELCHERHKKKGGIVTGSFNTILRPGLRKTFLDYTEQRTGVSEFHFPGKAYFVDPDEVIPVDPADEVYDDEYWRKLRRKSLEHEEPE